MKERKELLYKLAGSGLVGCEIKPIIVEELDQNYLKKETIAIFDETDYEFLKKKLKNLTERDFLLA